MDSETTAVSAPNISTDTPKLKLQRKRIRKLTAAEIANLLGALAAPEKQVEADLAYFIFFMLPVTAPISTPDEVAQNHDFANKLNEQAKSKSLGAVVSIGAANGVFEIVLKLTATGEQPSYGTPAVEAFTKLSEFLNSAAQLKARSDARQAVWKAKVNGTTIADGRY